ncbi:MAG: hypothetical protein ACHQU1_00705 [Gemmatimonadales bacterium]
MPITCSFDLERKLVIARATGMLTGEDVAGYQAEVWARPDVAGFDELIDMSGAAGVALANPAEMRQVAARAAAMDVPTVKPKLAIVAPQDSVYGLARMYEAYRNMSGGGGKTVAVFRTLEEGLEFLGLTDLPEEPHA